MTATATLRLGKGYNTGPISAAVDVIDDTGTTTAFNLTSATVTLEIYTETGLVVSSIAATIVTATSGTYTAIPGASALDDLTPGGRYFWRTKVVNATYPQGRLFAETENGSLQRVVIMGNSSGT